MLSSVRVPDARHLVLAGGGHTHALVARMLAMEPVPGLAVTLISDTPLAPYSGMLPGYVAGTYSARDIHIDLPRLAEAAGMQFIEASVTGLDPDSRLVRLRDRPPVHYDILSLNTGITPATAQVPGASLYTVPVKPVREFIVAWDRVVEWSRQHSVPLRLMVIGGGTGGTELAMCMKARLGAAADVTLVHARDRVPAGHSSRVQNLVMVKLQSMGVRLQTGAVVREVTRNALILGDGSVLGFDRAFWATHAAPASWLRDTGLELTADGFIRVTPTLQCPRHPEIFAAGDVAVIPEDPRPRSGVYAVRAAGPLAANLRLLLSGQKTRPWKPQRKFLALLATGDGEAVASRGWLSGRNRLWFRLKDHIDRKFMNQFAAMSMSGMSGAGEAGDGDGETSGPDTAAAEPVHSVAGTRPQDAQDPPKTQHLAIRDRELAFLVSRHRIRCHGCAAKVAGPVLRRVLARLRAEVPAVAQVGVRTPASPGLATDVVSGDDAAVFTVPPGRALVQTLDYMPVLVRDPWLFGRITALHCMNDIYAMGGTVHSALALVNQPLARTEIMEERIFQMLAGVVHELHAAGGALIGGHTGESREAGLGLTVNGLIEPERVMNIGGMRAGDDLILTKAVGTGVIFAGAMRLLSPANMLGAAVTSMLHSNRDAARILAEHGCRAATDVTGFGLAGHLANMAAASGVSSALFLEALPVLDGAIALSRSGVHSSLYRANVAGADVHVEKAAAGHEVLPLIFDPQTSGGLLAAVNPAQTASCLAALRLAGYPLAGVIGTVTAGAPGRIDVLRSAGPTGVPHAGQDPGVPPSM